MDEQIEFKESEVAQVILESIPLAEAAVLQPTEIPAEGQRTGILKETLQSLQRHVDKPIQKSAALNFSIQSGSVKERIAKLADLEAESQSQNRVIVPARSVRARAAALNTKGLAGLKKPSKKNAITPIRRKHSVKDIVSNIDLNQDIIQEQEPVEVTEPVKVSKLKEVP